MKLKDFSKENKRFWIYDIETYPNCFTLVVANAHGPQSYVFEISDRKDDSDDMRAFLVSLYKRKDFMVGFNNLGFDYPVLHHFLKNDDCTVDDLYRVAMGIIEAMRNDNRKNEFSVPYHKVLIPQLDLFKIHHFDNKARMTSLKMLEFNMRMKNIEDLPFPVGTMLTGDQMDTLIKYNKHDVKATYLFYRESLKAIDFRFELSNKYNKDFLNHNDTKIGKDYFVDMLEKHMPNSCFIDLGNGRRKLNQTKREFIDLGEIIYPYVEFKRPEFNAVLNWIKNQKIEETKGVFTELKEYELGEDLSQYAAMAKKQKKMSDQELILDEDGDPTDLCFDIMRKRWANPIMDIEKRKLKSKKNAYSYYRTWNEASNLNCVIDGFRFDFGTGGIHGSIEAQTVYSDDEYVILDVDVASMYPNIAIANRSFPLHLGEEFCNIYEDVYNQRVELKKAGKDAEQQMMKLALNGVYGDSNSIYSPFYDPQYTMTITINGQLSLCMLAEQFLEVDDLSLIQVNTDGVTVKFKREDFDRVREIYHAWEDQTGLELEEAIYDKMIIRDVNNYIAVYEGGKNVKRKGAYEYENLGWHKNWSSLVVKKAASAALIHGEDVETFIRNHDDIWDFMLRTKVPRSSKLLLENPYTGESKQIQNVTRYYISKSNDKFIKVMPPTATSKTGEDRRIGIDKEWFVTVCNDMRETDRLADLEDIDYDYYIAEAKKLVDCISQ